MEFCFVHTHKIHILLRAGDGLPLHAPREDSGFGGVLAALELVFPIRADAGEVFGGHSAVPVEVEDAVGTGAVAEEALAPRTRLVVDGDGVPAGLDDADTTVRAGEAAERVEALEVQNLLGFEGNFCAVFEV